MPRRLPASLLKRYFVVPHDQPLHFLRSFQEFSHTREAAAWFSVRPQFESALHKLLASQDGGIESFVPGVLSLPRFFREKTPLQLGFLVFSFHHCFSDFKADGRTFWLTRLWDDSRIQQIQAALSYSAPFKWDELYSGDFTDSWGTHMKKIQCYLFGQHIWTLTPSDSSAQPEELRLLFLDAVDSDRTRFERLKRKFSGAAGTKESPARERIPEHVRIYVWRRDAGCCVQCGSAHRLEYDHIIPVSKGGSSTERNIQLLCETCNRKKSDAI